MTNTDNRHIVLGVTGGIAAYKSVDLVRRLRDHDLDVRVVMTRAAQAFVTPLTFQAVSGNPVHCSLLDESAEAAMGHIELAKWADLVLIAPASADFMAKLAHGLADELLSTVCLATDAPIAVAPAMNQQMWQAAATRANRQTLLGRGVLVFGPGEGSQACGDFGPGRMLEPAELVTEVLAVFAVGCPGCLSGTRVLVTAGPTREPIDPVRYISNRSSGKMGYAIAQAALCAGAKVTLVSGPTELSGPSGVKYIQVSSAQEMYDEVMKQVGGCDIFIATAAVADYRPADYSDQKIKKHGSQRELSLVPTTDILASVSALTQAPFVVGFAAETQDLEANARSKLAAKNLDMIVANRVGLPGTGFGSDNNAVSVFWGDQCQEFPVTAKVDLARELILLLGNRYREKHPT